MTTLTTSSDVISSHANIPNTAHQESTQNTPKMYRRCEFTGRGAEDFKIWIVNIAFTLITLGIYSAWAKVRKNRYIYGNIIFEDASIEYLADPMVSPN
jgi:uncharacterized membrane protein YjgN (DUF898 family)